MRAGGGPRLPEHGASEERSGKNQPAPPRYCGHDRAPRLWPEDLDRAHDLWLRLQENFGARIHHRDVVGVALRRLEKDLDNDRRDEVLDDLGNELRKS